MLTGVFPSLYTQAQKSDDKAGKYRTIMSESRSEKQARLKASLRANLRKRKERDRAAAAQQASLQVADPPTGDQDDNV